MDPSKCLSVLSSAPLELLGDNCERGRKLGPMNADQSSQPHSQAQVTPDYIRGYRNGLAKGSLADSSQPLPYKSWFGCLLFGTLLTIILPHFADSKDSFYQPSSVLTFTEVNGEMQPTSEKIWIDGRTHALLSQRRWLYISTGLVLCQAILILVSRAVRRVRSNCTAT